MQFGNGKRQQFQYYRPMPRPVGRPRGSPDLIKSVRGPGPTTITGLTRQQFTEAFIHTFFSDFRADGNGLRAIQEVRIKRPDVYLKVASMIIPKEHKVESANVLTGLSDTQLDLMILQLMERIESAKPKTIDVTPEPEPTKRSRGKPLGPNKATRMMDEAIERDRLIAGERGSTDD